MRKKLVALILGLLLVGAVMAVKPSSTSAAGYNSWEHPVFHFVSYTGSQAQADANCRSVSYYYALRGNLWQRDQITGAWINYYDVWSIWGNVSTQTCVWNR